MLRAPVTGFAPFGGGGFVHVPVWCGDREAAMPIADIVRGITIALAVSASAAISARRPS